MITATTTVVSSCLYLLKAEPVPATFKYSPTGSDSYSKSKVIDFLSCCVVFVARSEGYTTGILLHAGRGRDPTDLFPIVTLNPKRDKVCLPT
jgi:hypothetical protein